MITHKKITSTYSERRIFCPQFEAVVRKKWELDLSPLKSKRNCKNEKQTGYTSRDVPLNAWIKEDFMYRRK